MACHFDIWWTQFPDLLSPKTCNTCHLSLATLQSIPYIYYLLPSDKYLYYYAISLPKRFSTKISCLLLVTYTQAVYASNHINLRNAVITGSLSPRCGNNHMASDRFFSQQLSFLTLNYIMLSSLNQTTAYDRASDERQNSTSHATGSRLSNYAYKLCPLTNSKAGRPVRAQKISRPPQAAESIEYSLLTIAKVNIS